MIILIQWIYNPSIAVQVPAKVSLSAIWATMAKKLETNVTNQVPVRQKRIRAYRNFLSPCLKSLYLF